MLDLEVRIQRRQIDKILSFLYTFKPGAAIDAALLIREMYPDRKQVRYIVTVAETGNITEAARQLFVSQPSLTNAIRELEKEMQITIFHRTNKGVTISNEGDEFLAYARQVL